MITKMSYLFIIIFLSENQIFLECIRIRLLQTSKWSNSHQLFQALLLHHLQVFFALVIFSLSFTWFDKFRIVLTRILFAHIILVFRTWCFRSKVFLLFVISRVAFNNCIISLLFIFAKCQSTISQFDIIGQASEILMNVV